MENHLRAALITWLRSDPALASINAIEEEAPPPSSQARLGLASPRAPRSTGAARDRVGREARVALELESRTDQPAADASLLAAIERRVLDLPPFQPGFELASVRFLRSRSETRGDNLRGALIEFRFRILEPLSE